MAESLLAHFDAPRNAGEIELPDAAAAAVNPACGDEASATFRLSAGTVVEMRYRVLGCHAAVAVMSAASERVRGRSAAEAARWTAEEIMGWFDRFPAGKRHAAELAAEVLARALGGPA